MTKCGKFLETWEYQAILPVSWEGCMQVKKQQLEPCIGTTDRFKIEKGVYNAVCCHPVYLTYMLSTSWEMPGGRNINSLRYADDPTLMAESEEELKSLLLRVKEKSERASLRLTIKKTKIVASAPITAWQIEGEMVEVETDFPFLGSQITADGDCSLEIRGQLLLGGQLLHRKWWQT